MLFGQHVFYAKPIASPGVLDIICYIHGIIIRVYARIVYHIAGLAFKQIHRGGDVMVSDEDVNSCCVVQTRSCDVIVLRAQPVCGCECNVGCRFSPRYTGS